MVLIIMVFKRRVECKWDTHTFVYTKHNIGIQMHIFYFMVRNGEQVVSLSIMCALPIM